MPPFYAKQAQLSLYYARLSKYHLTCASFSRFLRVDPRRTEPEYVYWFLQHLYHTGQMEEHQVQHTGVARFQYTKFAETTAVPLPIRAEQEAIARILGTLDDKIELNRRMNETLESMARAIFKSWFVDFDPVRAKAEGRQPTGMDAETAALFPARFSQSEFGNTPAGWTYRPIGDMVKVVGGSTPRTENPAFGGGSISFATPKDLAGLNSPVLLETERKITDTGAAQISSGILPRGTVLLSSRAPIGYLAVTDIPVTVNQGFIAMVCDAELPNHYVLHWTHMNMDAIIGRANGTTFLEISKANFRPIPALVPPGLVLRAFCDVIEPLHRHVVMSLRQSKVLASLRDALLPKLLSGEIRIRDAEKIVEARA